MGVEVEDDDRHREYWMSGGEGLRSGRPAEPYLMPWSVSHSPVNEEGITLLVGY